MAPSACHTCSKSSQLASTSNPSTATPIAAPVIGNVIPALATATTTTPVAHATITAITLSQTDLKEIEILDRSKNNWSVWSDKMKNYLFLKHGGGYILGLIPCPDPAVDPSSTGHWDLNNLCIIAALCTCSSPEEQVFLRSYDNANLAWNALQSRHEKIGPITQILLIQQALSIRYHQSERLSTTSTEISDMVRHIYVIGIPKEDDFATIIMLNAMNDELTHVHNHIANVLSTSTSTSSYGPTNICSRLDMEQQLIDADKKSSSNVVMVAGKGNRAQESHPGKTCSECGATDHSACCSTCKNWGHVAKDCFSKGGAMEGKCDEVLSRKCATRDTKSSPATRPSTKPTTTGKPGGLRYDTAGRAYLLDSETHEAIYVAATPPTSTPEPTQEFTGLVYDPLPSAHIQDLPGSDNEEYSALFMAVEDLKMSTNWRTHTKHVNFAGLTYKAPNQHKRTIVDPSLTPFFLDSGASVHISNTESDFYSLCPVPPRAVHGVGGSSISAIGIGSICLIIAKGIHLTLNHVLFIPTATVCLISVSAVCTVHRCIASFDATSCWVQGHNGTRMLTGTLMSRR
jgi:hypothetical protein